MRCGPLVLLQRHGGPVDRGGVDDSPLFLTPAIRTGGSPLQQRSRPVVQPGMRPQAGDDHHQPELQVAPVVLGEVGTEEVRHVVRFLAVLHLLGLLLEQLTQLHQVDNDACQTTVSRRRRHTAASAHTRGKERTEADTTRLAGTDVPPDTARRITVHEGIVGPRDGVHRLPVETVNWHAVTAH